MVLKWGIVGAGNISHDFVTSLRTLPENEHHVLAIAGRDKQRVEKFAKEHNIRKEYTDYGNMAQDYEVDIVYVGNLANQHYDVCKLMLEVGKHVLCEKPLTMNAKQTYSLLQIAKEENVFFMEAVWSRCFPAYKKLQEIIESGAIGEVLFCSADFGHPLTHVERFTSSKLCGSTITELGIYPLQFQQMIFKGLKPVNIAVNGHKNSAGLDESVGMIITYEGGKTAVLTTTIRVCMPNEGYVVGTKGTIKLPNFWCPTELITPETTYTWQLPETSIPIIHVNSTGLAYEAVEAKRCIDAGLVESPAITHEETLELAKLMDLVRKQLGVVFPEDSKEY